MIPRVMFFSFPWRRCLWGYESNLEAILFFPLELVLLVLIIIILIIVIIITKSDARTSLDLMASVMTR